MICNVLERFKICFNVSACFVGVFCLSIDGSIGAAFSWGAPHPSLDAPKLCGGGRRGNSRNDTEIRAQVRGIRKHFPDDDWRAFSRRIWRVNRIRASAKTCKRWCLANTTSVAPKRRRELYSASYRSTAIILVTGYDRDDNGDRKHRHSLNRVVAILKQRAGRAGRSPDKRTLRRWLIDSGFRYRWRPKRIRLTGEHLRKREEFCDEAEEKDAAAWEVVVFTDSTMVCKNHVPVPQNDGAWCTSDEQPSPQSYFRHPQTFHTYGGITPFGLIGPIFVDRITAATYLPVLKKLCKLAAKKYADAGLDGEFVVQQDGASAHTSDLIQDWIAEEEIYDVWPKDSWPPASPDLSIIENVWSELQEYVAPLGNEPKTSAAAKSRIRRFFSEYSPERCQKLYASIPGRLKECRDNDFYSIKT